MTSTRTNKTRVIDGAPVSSPRWGVVGKRLLDEIVGLSSRGTAAEACVAYRVRLHLNFDDQFVKYDAKEKAKLVSGTKLLVEQIDRSFAVQHSYAGGGHPILSNPDRYSRASAAAAAGRIICAKTDSPLRYFAHAGDAAVVCPDSGLVIGTTFLKIWRPIERVAEMETLYHSALDAFRGAFVSASLCIEPVGEMSVAHLRRRDTTLSSLWVVAYQPLARMMKKQGVIFIAGAFGRKAMPTPALEKLARDALSSLPLRVSTEEWGIAFVPSKAIDLQAPFETRALATRTMGRHILEAVDVVRKNLRKKRMQQWSRELPPVEDVIARAVERVARSTGAGRAKRRSPR